MCIYFEVHSLLVSKIPSPGRLALEASFLPRITEKQSNTMSQGSDNPQQFNKGPLAKFKKLQLPSKIQPTPEQREQEELWNAPQSPGSSRGDPTTRERLWHAVRKEKLNMYTHEDLQEGQIRLLILKPAQDEKADICIELKSHTFEEVQEIMSSLHCLTTGGTELPKNQYLSAIRMGNIWRMLCSAGCTTPCTMTLLESDSTSSPIFTKPCDACDRRRMILHCGSMQYVSINRIRTKRSHK